MNTNINNFLNEKSLEVIYEQFKQGGLQLKDLNGNKFETRKREIRDFLINVDFLEDIFDTKRNRWYIKIKQK